VHQCSDHYELIEKPWDALCTHDRRCSDSYCCIAEPEYTPTAEEKELHRKSMYVLLAIVFASAALYFCRPQRFMQRRANKREAAAREAASVPRMSIEVERRIQHKSVMRLQSTMGGGGAGKAYQPPKLGGGGGSGTATFSKFGSMASVGGRDRSETGESAYNFDPSTIDERLVPRDKVNRVCDEVKRS
jgi:hypothetical protein